MLMSKDTAVTHSFTLGMSLGLVMQTLITTDYDNVLHFDPFMQPPCSRVYWSLVCLLQAHFDGPTFWPVVATLNLGSHTMLDFYRPIPDTLATQVMLHLTITYKIQFKIRIETICMKM